MSAELSGDGPHGLFRERRRADIEHAPFDGVVITGDLRKQIGAVMQQGTPLFEIAPLDSWTLEMDVPEGVAGDLIAGLDGAGAFPGRFAAGVVTAANETVVRAASPGFVEKTAFETGEDAKAGDLLVCLSNSSLEENVARARAALEACRVRKLAYESADPSAARQESERMRTHEGALAHYLKQQDDLHVSAPTAGRIIDGIRASDVGRFVAAGDVLASLISGDWEVRAVITAEQYVSASPTVGDRVSFRVADAADTTLDGEITAVSPTGSRRVELPSLTAIAGGDVVVEPETGQATQPYFELRIALDDAPDVPLRQGLTGVIQMHSRAEPILTRAYRNVTRFINKIRKN